jgi:hypothetical protein
MPQQQKIINIMSFFHFCQGLAPSKASKASLETVVPVCMTCVFFSTGAGGPKDETRSGSAEGHFANLKLGPPGFSSLQFVLQLFFFVTCLLGSSSSSTAGHRNEDKGTHTDEESSSSECHPPEEPAPAKGPKGARPKTAGMPKLEPVEEETPCKDALMGKQKNKPKGNGKGKGK